MKTIVFYLFLGLVAVFSGFGWKYGNETAINLILVAPFFLFFLDLIDKRKIFIPKKITFLFLVFLILISVSNFFSIDFKLSFGIGIFCFSLFLFFIYAHNHAQELKKSLPVFINLLSIVLIITSLVIEYVPKNSFFYPFDDKNLIFPSHDPHNHLGDFLAMSVVFNFYFLAEAFSWTRLIVILFFIPFLLFSHSRSAYTSLIIPSTYLIWRFLRKNKQDKVKKYNRLTLISVFIFIFAATIVFFVTQPRSLINGREYYFNYALKGFKNKPLTGYGLGNFFSMVKEIKDKNTPNVQSSHNIFLDVFVGSGFFSGTIFVILILSIFIYGQKNAYWFAFFSMLINFQTDYTYKIAFLLLFLFLTAGMIWEEHNV